MKRDREFELFTELAKLLKKYGPETFDNLDHLLRSSDMVNTLSNILTASSSIYRSNVKKNKSSKDYFSKTPEFLKSISTTEPNKYSLLSQLFDDLLNNKKLPSLKLIQEFANDLGISKTKSKSRIKAIDEIILKLSQLIEEKIIDRIDSTKNYQNDDRTLKGWSDIILKNQNPERE